MKSYLKNMVINAVRPKVNKTKLDEAKSNLNIAIQGTKGSKAKLKQTLFEIENKMPLTFKNQRGIKTKSNTEKAKIRNEESKKMFKKTMEDNKKVIKNIMRGGKESKKDGGRMGLKKGSKFPDHSGDGKITQKDILMAKGVIPKTKSKSKKKVI
jgi:hypothetical protein